MQDGLDKLIRKSIKDYFKGGKPTKTYEASGKTPKYTKKYFDTIEKSRFGEATELE